MRDYMADGIRDPLCFFPGLATGIVRAGFLRDETWMIGMQRHLEFLKETTLFWWA
jgi:hypothetical protein